MQIQHTILSATVTTGPDVPVTVQQSLIGAPAGWPSVTAQLVIPALNADKPAWTNDDVVAAYVAAGLSQPGDLVAWVAPSPAQVAAIAADVAAAAAPSGPLTPAAPSGS